MHSKAARRRVIELLEQVGIPAPESRLSAYPHQLSGGTNQRVMELEGIVGPANHAGKREILVGDEEGGGY